MYLCSIYTLKEATNRENKGENKMPETNPKMTFDDSAKEFILSLFDKKSSKTVKSWRKTLMRS